MGAPKKQDKPKQQKLSDFVPASIEEIEDAADEYLEAYEAAVLASQQKQDAAERLIDTLRQNAAILERIDRELIYSREGMHIQLREKESLKVRRLKPRTEGGE